MRKDSEIAHKIKRQIEHFCMDCSRGLSRPLQKFIFQMVYGILASKSVHLTKIGRSLNEGIRLLYTVKRLSRNLAHEGLEEELQENCLARLGQVVEERTVIGLDLSDLCKPYATRMEHLCEVYDGSEGEVKDHGYPWITAVAAGSEGEVVPLYARLFSYRAEDFRSENEEIWRAIEVIFRHTDGRGIISIDRGGDRGVILSKLITGGYHFNIRLRGDRELIRISDKQVRRAMEIASQVEPHYKQTVSLTVDGEEKSYRLRYGSVEVCLPGFEKVLWLVVIWGFGEEPILLLTDLSARGELVVKRAEEYLLRWRCEEHIRFLKQGFDLEDIRLLRYRRLQNMMVLLLLALGILCKIGYISSHLTLLKHKIIEKSRRLFQTPKFLYYTLADGIWEYLKFYRPKVVAHIPIPIKSGQLVLFSEI
ncbi:MAG: hypothetical protein D6813_11870 [Calditrichaeota bacterium]|nr:MAG: hypothetical protein D6813_11870 [Calditrichota bacterium]